MNVPQPEFHLEDVDLDTVDSIVLRRLIEEVRQEGVQPQGYNRIYNRYMGDKKYNRTYSRHNR